MAEYLANRDGGKTDEHGLLRALSKVVGNDVIEGVAAFVESQLGGLTTPRVIAAAIREQLQYGVAFKAIEPSPRITEQDAREIAISFYYYRTNQSKNTIESFKLWLNCEGRVLLDKLNEDK